ncbi:MAG TPA: SDR family NAD(P)-dependent oxidoreductase [Rhodospirillales bacterium]|nr:SDR family NAD(P)-dependent oxidoreductase [Rhodospirillales bacterium]
MAEGRLHGRVTLVTGASRGIGRAIALRFASEGAHVIALSRTQGALEELDDDIQSIGGENATLVPADLTDFDMIDRMGASIYERFGRLDVLVGNAGILTRLTPMAQIPPREWEATLAINLTANWRLLRSFDPLLRLSDAGRAIFITAEQAATHKPFWGAYGVSKAALESMVKTYAAENVKTNVCANLFDPGPTRTGLRTVAYPGEKPESLQAPEDVTDAIVELALASCTINGETIRSPDPLPA